MKLLFKLLVAGFAIVGVAFVAFTVYVNVSQSPCSFYQSANVFSKDGKYAASFDQTVCAEPSKSRASVTMWKTSSPAERIVWLKVQGTNDVTLTWNDNRELVVRLPKAAGTQKFGPYDDWPQIVEVRE